MDIAAALITARKTLSGSESPAVDAAVLLCHVLQCQPTRLHAFPEQVLTSLQQADFLSLIMRRQAGEPVAYLTGQRGFWSLDLAVSTATLIPRPDTETLVSCALDKLATGMRVVDLGTGTGAVALALASSRQDIMLLAMDYSAAALKVARQNSQQLAITLPLWHGEWTAALASQSVDMIVSNPPYIPASDPHLQQGDVRFEPQSALVAGADGLDDLRQIIADAPRCLTLAGWLLVEHGYDQSDAVQALFIAAGFVAVETVQDDGGQDRVTMGRKGGEV